MPLTWDPAEGSPGLAAIVDALDEEQALNLFNRLRSRFDWSGTVFVRQDVVDAVQAAASDELAPEREAELVDAVMDGDAYRKLGDRFAELGNELLADEAHLALKGDTDL